MKIYKPINVVCFGGGTGLPSLLSGLKHNPWLKITAIVNMFDTGGSSGELKDKFGILPPGDILKCLLALSNNETYAREILLKRVHNERSSIHTGGNILLMGFERVFEDHYSAVDALGQILEISGTVIPVTNQQSSLKALHTDGTESNGETSVDSGIFEGKIVSKLSLMPPVHAHPKALQAIEQADVICIGPGSFYTSVLPNFLPDGMGEAISQSKAAVIYIANLMTEGWGMKDFTIQTITEIVESYIHKTVDAIVVNTKKPERKILDRYLNERKLLIRTEAESGISERLIGAELWEDLSIARHDTAKLASLVANTMFNLIKQPPH